MNLKYFFGLGLLALSASAYAGDVESARTLKLYDEAVFYDGYQENVVDQGVEDGIVRLKNFLYTRRLSEADLDWFGEDLRMNVVIGAACDNYDRIGNISLAFVPKGSERYGIDAVDRIEIGRFITPFMNKNAKIKEVPYVYDVPALSLIFRDKSLRDKFDFWVEFEVFGVPYAANTQIIGCKGRQDVFKGTLSFSSESEPKGATTDNVLVPIVMKRTEVYGPVNMNNYREEATDTLGVTTRTYTFSVPEDVADARITLITSDHGANEDGEEYNRRRHLVYYDGEIAMDYTPGGVSCEPYRQYNTQKNMIYGWEPDYDFWYNYSNWCPGAVIPIRELHLGAVKAGEHKLMIRVPDAVFNESQGDIYVSAYFQGSKKGLVPSDVPSLAQDAGFEFSIEGNIVRFTGSEEAREVAVYSYDGQLLYGRHNPGSEVSLEGFGSGAYIVSVRTADGRAGVCKVIVR